MNKNERSKIKDWYRLFPQSRNKVHCQGESLSDIIWQGKQWAVTVYGLERRDGTYHVPVENFFNFPPTPKGRKKEKQDVFLHWFRHLGEKYWCDEDDIDHVLQAMLVLYQLDKNRSSVEALFLMNEAEIEAKALEAADKAYQDTKYRLLHGLPL